MTSGFTYVLPAAPSIATVSPPNGPTTGGTRITISGQNFVGIAGVSLGGVDATSFAVVDTSTITAVAPPRAAGAADVSIRTSEGLRADLAGGFTYLRATAVDNILSFGDSITFGTSSELVSTGSGVIKVNTTIDGGYPAKMRNRLQPAYPAQNIIVFNQGVPGECASVAGCSGTSDAGGNRLPRTLTPTQDLVILLEGVNDINIGRAFDNIIGSLRSMIQSAKSAGKAVIISTLLPVKRGEDLVLQGCTGINCYRVDPAAIESLNTRIRSLASEQAVILVDMFSAFGSNNALLSPDGLHPNSAGYERMAQAFADAIIQRFETVKPIVP